MGNSRRRVDQAQRSRPPRPASTAAIPAAGRETAPAPSRVLWAALAALLVVRVVAAWVPGTWLWGANALRFADPRSGWALWGAAALALIPPIAKRLAIVLNAAGDSIAAGNQGLRVCAALGAAALAVLLQDRTYFVGDALLRLGTANALSDPRVLAPGGAGQLLPLDVALHYQLPRLLIAARVAAAPVTVARGLGALEAALYTWLAIELARALGLRGAAAAAAAGTAFFGGALFLFTGYDKSFTEMCVVTAAVGVAALRAARGEPALLELGVAATAGALLHRSALALGPVVLLAWIGWWRRARAATRWSNALPGIALPIATAALVLPRVIRTMGSLDLRQNLALPHAADVAAGGLDPMMRACDLLSFALLVAPLSLAVPLLLPALPREDRRGHDLAVLLALALPFLGMLLLLRGPQGMYRDWDVFAACGVALALLAAWAVGRTIAAAPRSGAGLAVAVVLAVAAMALTWLGLFHNPDRGLRRVIAFATEPPRRPETERVATWDYLGSMAYARGDFVDAAHAWTQAARLAPSLRMNYTLGLALERAGRPREAQAAYRAALQRDSTSVVAWTALRDVSIAARDGPLALRAAAAVVRLLPEDPRAREVRARVDTLARLWRGSSGRLPERADDGAR